MRLHISKLSIKLTLTVGAILTIFMAGDLMLSLHNTRQTSGKEYREIHKRMILDFKRDEVRAVGQTYATLGDKVCEKCHGDADMPMNKDVDTKYEFIFEDRMKKARTSFHRITPSEGAH